jgi:hypothetical protein
MSKCEFVFEMLTDQYGRPTIGPAIARCKTHDCVLPITTISEGQVCLIGRIEVLEERVAQLERPTTVPLIDELGNPFSLRRPAKLEGD